MDTDVNYPLQPASQHVRPVADWLDRPEDIPRRQHLRGMLLSWPSTEGPQGDGPLPVPGSDRAADPAFWVRLSMLRRLALRVQLNVACETPASIFTFSQVSSSAGRSPTARRTNLAANFPHRQRRRCGASNVAASSAKPEFCSSMRRWRRPSERQLGWLAAIASKLGGER